MIPTELKIIITSLVVRSLFFTYICKRKFFTTKYLRCVGKQWSCPAYILPLFFKTPDERVTPRNLSDSVECPMMGNNWTPARPDGGERPTSFLKSQKLLKNLLCRFTMTHNEFALGAVADFGARCNIELTT